MTTPCSGSLRKVRPISCQRPVTAEQAPQSLLDRFRERDGTAGRIAAVNARRTRAGGGGKFQAFVKAVRGVRWRQGLRRHRGQGDLRGPAAEHRDEGRAPPSSRSPGVMLLVFIFFRDLRTSLEVVGR